MEQHQYNTSLTLLAPPGAANKHTFGAFSASGHFTFRGFVYHPNMDCNVSGGAVIEGAMLCESFSGGGDGVHFDEDLAIQVERPVDNGIRLLAWREVD